ncbi:MAG: sigma-54-dependent Fis family transcriptional regulator [Bdellovibrionales bacterium]|nr:sigma-54-dependent Fis family transcriptional regulator [Bdellovibrionales bacterium]
MSIVFRPTILYVDDEASNTLIFKKTFEDEYLVSTAQSGVEALEIVKEKDFALCLVDQRMPGMTGIELCEKLIEVGADAVRVMVTAYQEPELLLDAIGRGHVYDYVVKPWNKSQLKEVIERAFAYYKNKVEKVRKLEEQVGDLSILIQKQQSQNVSQSWVGIDGGLKSVKKMVDQVAPTNSTVMIYGETGTGKELVAHHIHQLSHRKTKPFIPVHCAGLSESLLESELFGHEKGAFTGADHQKKGLFEIGDGGTVFLDEIGEVSENVQVKLLRVLQEKQIQRVGSATPIDVDIRVVAATNRNLEQEVDFGRFRSDLFFRLNVIPITVPPLRERMEDFPALIDFFLQKLNRDMNKNVQISKEALNMLVQYDWPGNVRELQNIIERAVALASKNKLGVEDLQFISQVQAIPSNNKQVTTRSVRQTIIQKKKKKLEQALLNADGNISKAARNMGVARSTLYDQLKKYQLI